MRYRSQYPRAYRRRQQQTCNSDLFEGPPPRHMINNNMASTRRQRTKGKSLCLTDFFSHNELAGSTPPNALLLGAQSPPTSPTQSTTGDALEGGPGSANPAGSFDHQPYQPPQGPNGLKRGTSVSTSHKSPNSETASLCCESHSSPGSSTTSSPVKHRAKLDIPGMKETDSSSLQEDMLGAFLVTDQASSPALLKDMMLALRSSINTNLTTTLSSQKAAIDDLGKRVDHVETELADFWEAHNGLVDAHNSLEEDFRALSAKVPDIEDRNRRNNIKIRGIPDSVLNSELTHYIQRAMATLLHSTSKRDLIIDRAHRLPKPFSTLKKPLCVSPETLLNYQSRTNS